MINYFAIGIIQLLIMALSKKYIGLFLIANQISIAACMVVALIVVFLWPVVNIVAIFNMLNQDYED